VSAGTLLAVTTRALLLVAAVLLPSALPPASEAPRADLVLVVVAAVALVRGPTTGLLTGLAGGWLLDVVPPGAEPLGAGALVYAAAGALLGLARRALVVSPVLPWAATAGAAALVLAVRWVGSAAGVGRATPTEVGWSWLATAVVAAVLVPVLVALERRTGHRAERDGRLPARGAWR
jgi:rod shape-determining protein MreD